LLRSVLRVAELTEFGEGLHLLTEPVRQLIAVHVATFRGEGPQLSSHDLLCLSEKPSATAPPRRLSAVGGHAASPARLRTGSGVRPEVSPRSRGEQPKRRAVAEWPRDAPCDRQ